MHYHLQKFVELYFFMPPETFDRDRLKRWLFAQKYPFFSQKDDSNNFYCCYYILNTSFMWGAII